MKSNNKSAASVDAGIRPLEFVELNRYFASVDKDKEIPLETPPFWGRKLYGWMGWPALLQNKWVVLLAEAGSGKTEEFLARSRIIRAEGGCAFFVRVEDLVDAGLDASLDAQSAELLESWKSGAGIAYFFLDSVDEARLNQKNFETALRRFARELNTALGRAHVMVSCRISDWRGRQDYAAMQRLLPLPVPEPETTADRGDALLDPIFKKRETKQPEAEAKLSELTVVRLVALSDDNRRTLAEASGIADPDAFMAAISRYGLNALADRPADLLELAEYWKSHRRFDCLRAMTEHTVTLKLAERDPFRADSSILPSEKARLGAERIAAALTLGHTFTVRAPGQEPDPMLAAGALDAADILPDWSDGERSALLRRAVFAPATYGRVRFHHRGTQEYLAASWLDRLLRAGCPRDRIMTLLFATRYGTDTVVPSLRAEAAWLALGHADIRDEIVRREPTALIQSGDPGSLPVAVRQALLRRFAHLHRSGDISNDRLDDRAIWLFAHQELADAVVEAWAHNDRDDFRAHLLRIIREGKIAACQALWREALAGASADYLKILGLEAASACGDAELLAQVATELSSEPGRFREDLAARFAATLFPHYLTTGQLLGVIEGCQSVSPSTVSGFAYGLDSLFGACRSRDERLTLLGGLAELVLRPPFQSEHQRISQRYFRIAEHLVPPACQMIEELDAGTPPPSLVRALMAVERGDSYHRHDDEAKLRSAVTAHSQLNRALFWADVDAAEEHARGERGRPTSEHQVHHDGGSLWGFGVGDLGWLIEDVRSTRVIGDRQMALGAAAGVLARAGLLDARVSELRSVVSGISELEAELQQWLRPRVPSPEEEEYSRKRLERANERVTGEERDKQSWRTLRAELQADPGRITDEARLADAQSGAIGDLRNLTRWLTDHTGLREEEKAVLHWKALASGFDSDAIAESYRRGMKRFWRHAALSWPVRTPGGGITTYWTTEIAYAGVCLEAADDPEWAQKLSADEARRATSLACRSEKSYPAWLDDLVAARPEETLPVVREALIREWIIPGEQQRSLLYHYAHATEEQAPAIRAMLVDVLLGEDTPDDRTAELGVRALRRNIATPDNTRLTEVATRRFDGALSAAHEERVLISLALLFLVDTRLGRDRLRQWIDSAPAHERTALASAALARLFGRDQSLAVGSLSSMPVDVLAVLTRLAYIEVSPLSDIHHEGSYTPGPRDAAESARNAVLSAVIERPGPEAFAALCDIGTSGIAGIRPIRFRELAHGKAERDAEIIPWQPRDVVAFAGTFLLPIKTADEFNAALLRTLDDIQYDLRQQDVSPRALLRTASNEEQVQGWLADALRVRSRGRYHTHREPIVADKKEPDIVVAGIGIAAEVAIEIKHANKGWSVRDLEQALRTQLAEHYLRPSSRRHGVLIVTLHAPQTWRAPEDNAVMSFSEVIARLAALAAVTTRNATGPISVRVVGIDVS